MNNAKRLVLYASVFILCFVFSCNNPSQIIERYVGQYKFLIPNNYYFNYDSNDLLEGKLWSLKTKMGFAGYNEMSVLYGYNKADYFNTIGEKNIVARDTLGGSVREIFLRPANKELGIEVIIMDRSKFIDKWDTVYGPRTLCLQMGVITSSAEQKEEVLKIFESVKPR